MHLEYVMYIQMYISLHDAHSPLNKSGACPQTDTGADSLTYLMVFAHLAEGCEMLTEMHMRCVFLLQCILLSSLLFLFIHIPLLE